MIYIILFFDRDWEYRCARALLIFVMAIFSQLGGRFPLWETFDFYYQVKYILDITIAFFVLPIVTLRIKLFKVFWNDIEDKPGGVKKMFDLQG